MSRGRRGGGALVLAALLLASGCVPTQQAQNAPSPTPRADTFPVTLTDDEGVNVTLEEEPERIVTWGPSLTEVLFELDLGERVVGVSGPFDDFPAEAADIEHVGGANLQPNLEKVVSLDPDLVLDAFGGGEEWKERLRDQDVPVFALQAANFDDLLHDIQTVGRLTGALEAATELTTEMADEADEIREAVAEEEPVSCFFEVGFQGGFFTVGPGSFIYDLLERAGCDPVTSDADQPFPQWSVERLVEDDPEVYLVSSESGASVEQVARRPGFGSLTAVEEGNVVLIDSALVSRAGPRVVRGLRELAEGLHPEAF